MMALSGIPSCFGNLDEFLRDHANCERKASAQALSLVVKYPDRRALIPGLIALAREELEHFEEVYAVLARRGLALACDTRDPYVQRLQGVMRHGRDERLVDRMLVASLVECRGAERFGLLADALEDAELAALYRRLWQSETKHGHVFVHLLLQEFPDEQVYSRLPELAAAEAEIIGSLPLRAALH